MDEIDSFVERLIMTIVHANYGDLMENDFYGTPEDYDEQCAEQANELRREYQGLKQALPLENDR